jgi:hypothetical protein
MVLKSKENGLIIGFVPGLIDTGVAVLQYFDDTIFCIQHDPGQEINLKMLLYMFKMMFG